MERTNLNLSLHNRLGELEHMNQFIERLDEKMQLPAGVAMTLNLALEEVVSNIIKYAYDDEGDHEIEIQFTREGNLLTVKIKDDGQEFNVLEFPKPDINAAAEDRNIGGLGIHFVKELMDTVEYQYKNNKNILVLSKNLGE